MKTLFRGIGIIGSVTALAGFFSGDSLFGIVSTTTTIHTALLAIGCIALFIGFGDFSKTTQQHPIVSVSPEAPSEEQKSKPVRRKKSDTSVGAL